MQPGFASAAQQTMKRKNVISQVTLEQSSPEVLKARADHEAAGYWKTNMKETLKNMLASDKELDLTKVETKTCILWGKKDTTTPPRQATEMYEKLPNAELKFYANWTHAPYISNPDELARALTTLVERMKK